MVLYPDFVSRVVYDLKWNLLFSLEIEFGGESVATAQPLDRSAVGLDVNDVADLNSLFLK